MKKLLAFLVAASVLLAGCGGPEDPTTDLNDIDETLPYYIHLIGDPEYHGWFDNLKEQRANATQSSGDIFIFHKVDSAFDSKELVADLVNKRSDGYVNFIFVGLGPNNYEGGTQEQAEQSFNKNKQFVNELIDLTLYNDVVLLVSNGYPKPADQTDEYLLWNHEQMLLFFKEQMEATYRVYMFSIKRPLGDDAGALIDMTDEEKYGSLTNDFITYLTLIKKRI
ncbi:hypothetical protein ACFLZH_01515 [Patescibacteria group bacterium]